MPQMGIILRTYIHYGAQIFTSLKADSTIYDVNDWVLYTFILFSTSRLYTYIRILNLELNNCLFFLN